ncbi:hypothetical protein DFH27DRAFT_247469 [Peziza echinospora]|nr:hypothetical protein DFH27DRAFT_247469 [Peziza echinospora]
MGCVWHVCAPTTRRRLPRTPWKPAGGAKEEVDRAGGQHGYRQTGGEPGLGAEGWTESSPYPSMFCEAATAARKVGSFSGVPEQCCVASVQLIVLVGGSLWMELVDSSRRSQLPRWIAHSSNLINWEALQDRRSSPPASTGTHSINVSWAASSGGEWQPVSLRVVAEGGALSWAVVGIIGRSGVRRGVVYGLQSSPPKIKVESGRRD